MSYSKDYPIDWQTIRDADKWLDGSVSIEYIECPLAQDWARVSKVSEELGEAIAELILATGQNPRKDSGFAMREAHKDLMLAELGDVVLTGILAIQHFTKRTSDTRAIIFRAIGKLESRLPRSV